MKKTIHQILNAAACFAAALCAGIALTACTSDANEPGNAGHDRTPLVINASVAAPATTRANTAASEWTDGDEMAVEMDGVVKKYIIKGDAAAGTTATLRPADAANTHFWPDLSQPVIVRAWRYGAVTDLGGYTSEWNVKPAAWRVSGTQHLTTDGESGYQRSDFLYAPAKSVSYDAAAGTGLTFYHQTARVIVKIRKAGLVNDGNKESMEVRLGSGGSDNTMLTHATFDALQIKPGNGQYSGLTADGTKERGDIIANPMPASSPTPTGFARCYEALVIPQNMDGEKFIGITIPGTGTYYYKPADGEANLRGGYTYTYDITVSKYGTLHVTVGTPITPWGQQEGDSGTAYNEIINLDNPQIINDDRVYLMTGERTPLLLPPLQITGGRPTIIVRDLYLDAGGIHITGGTPEIRVEGTNNVLIGYDQPAIWLDGEDANVRITGEGINESKLLVNPETYSPDKALTAIGSEGREYEASACGNIEISNLTLEASTIDWNCGTGAVIGTGGGRGNRKCGNITITDAYVIAEANLYAPAIGFGSADSDIGVDMTGTAYEMGDITITNSTIEAMSRTRTVRIGGGAKVAETYQVGAIRINTDKSATEFFEKFTNDTKPNDEVIVGFPVGSEPKDGTRFDIYWNGKPVGAAITWSMVPGLP